MTITFTPVTAHEVQDLIGDTDAVSTVYWHIDDPEQAPVVVDVLGKRMLVHRVSLHIAEGEQRVYLGGFAASKVSNRNVSADPFISMIELEDHWATLGELCGGETPLSFVPVESPFYGVLDPSETAHG
jgi:hypothetical protein